MMEIARSAYEHLPWDQRWWATFVLPNQADRTAQEGNLTAAWNQFRHLIDTYGAVFPDQTALMTMRLALIDLERGDAVSALNKMDIIGPVPSPGYWMQEIPRARAKVLHALGRDEEAQSLLYAAIRETSSDLNEIDVRRNRTVLAQLQLDRGAVDLADAWAAEESLSMDAWPRSFGHTVSAAVMAHYHLLRGRGATAIVLLDALIDEGLRREQRAPLVRVYALKALALALARDIPACHEAIRAAIAIGEPHGFHRSYLVGSLDTRLLLGSPEQTLSLALSFASPPGASAAVTLTKRERDVLLSAMEGLTNADIATQLFISPMTVKNHLARIYQRLGVRNREEAAIAARSRGLL